MQWYCLYAKPGDEGKIAEQIRRQIPTKLQGIVEEVMAPETSFMSADMKKVFKKKIYPGYVFLKMEMNEANYYKVLYTPLSSVRFVERGRVIPDNEMAFVFENIEKSKGIIKASEFKVGNDVKVVEGPFRGFIGRIESVNDAKRAISATMTIFGRLTLVDLDQQVVELL